MICYSPKFKLMYQYVYECHYALNNGRVLNRLHATNILENETNKVKLRNQTILSHKLSDRWIRIKTQRRISLPNRIFVLYNKFKRTTKNIDTTIFYNTKDKKFLLSNDLLVEDQYYDGVEWELCPMQPTCKLKRINLKQEQL